jgi:hypothetical protein
VRRARPHLHHTPQLTRPLRICRRWLEYSFSASTMCIAIAIVGGIQEQNTLLGLFFLITATMWCGFFTEMVSRPNDDRESWKGDPVTTDSRYYAKRRLNYYWRMLPHALGFLPYGAAWTIIINSFQEQVDDQCDGDENMPLFVFVIVYGCFILFSTFTFVQWW